MLRSTRLTIANQSSLYQYGFSLLEMAVVMLIISFLLGGLLMSLGSAREINNRTDAEDMLNEIKEALYGFAQANGRLPCPARRNSNGREVPNGGGACNQRFGFVPSLTLGLSGDLNDDNLLTDEWLNPYRYYVVNSNGSAFTTANGMRNQGMAGLTPNFRVCGDAACGTVLVNRIPVIIMSQGADWNTFTAADVDETESSGEQTIAGYRHGNDRNFVTAPYIEDTFDDQITWLSLSILFTRMISAGQLP
jgi:prepilin-type N-terminal cleavage/methylation domain-containing protein